MKAIIVYYTTVVLYFEEITFKFETDLEIQKQNIETLDDLKQYINVIRDTSGKGRKVRGGMLVG
jgi:hypothetical protein